MEIRMDLERLMGRGRGQRKQKRRRGRGPVVPGAPEVLEETAEVLARRRAEWLERLTANPSDFADIELEVHAELRHQADRLVASLLSAATEDTEMTEHVQRVMARAETPLRPVEKKDAP